MRILITQSNYIPWKGYFDNIAMADLMVLYDDVQYTKRDWRNRNRVKTPYGLRWITIPVQVSGKFYQKINETLISDKDWGKKNFDQLRTNYAKAKHFDKYIKLFEDIYLKNSEIRLSFINQLFIEAINDILNIKTEIKRSENFLLNGSKTEKLINICLECGADEYITGPAAKNYIDEALFEKNNIKIIYSDYSGYPEYSQLYGEFVHEVSILDLIFNEGKESVKYMKNL